HDDGTGSDRAPARGPEASRGVVRSRRGREGRRRAASGGDADGLQDFVSVTAIDPVCHMTVQPANAPGGSAEYRGPTYYFCTPRCRARFGADPKSFLGKKGTVPFSATSYTCPMHPEIVRPGPGACPICGMDLEPLMPAEGEDGSPELRAMTRRLVVCTI